MIDRDTDQATPLPSTVAPTNGSAIESDIAWFSRVLDLRFRIHGGEVADGDVLERLPPPPAALGTPYGDLAGGLAPPERLILILALLPLLRPQALDSFLIPNSQSGRPFTEFGGAPAGRRLGFQPTRETALFLLGGEDMDRRLAAMALFRPGSPLHKRRILDLPEAQADVGPWTALGVDASCFDRLTAFATVAGPRRPPKLRRGDR